MKHETSRDLLDVPLEQLELERRMAELGAARARRQTERAILKGRRTATPSGAALLQRAARELTRGVRRWRANAKVKAKKHGNAPASLALLDGTPDRPVAAVVARTVLDRCLGRQPLARVAHAVGAALEYEGKCRAIARAANTASSGGKQTSLWRDLRKTLAKRKGKYARRKVVRNVAAQLAAERAPWTRADRIRVGVLMVTLMAQRTGLVEVVNVRGKRGRSKAFVVPTQLALDALAARDAGQELLPVYLPSLHAPRDWTTAVDGGYLSNALVRRPLVKSRAPAQVAALERARPTAVYRAVNVLQRVPWRVNRKVLGVAQDLLDARDPLLLGPVSDAPLPPRPTTEKRRGDPEWTAWIRAAADAKRARDEAVGRGMQAARTLQVAGEFEKRAFFLPMQVDFRGRVYPVPSFLNPQGPDLARGLLQFDEGAMVRDREQLQALHTHGANCWGLDKLPFRERSAWVAQHVAEIRKVAEDPHGFRWWTQAEEPWQFLAFCLAYAEREADPKAPLHLPCYFDCSNSGLQLFSMLARDPVGAAATNCVPTEAPADVYRVVADTTTALLMAAPEPEAAQWLEFLDGRVPRNFVKRVTMTLPYSATFHSAVHYVRAAYDERRVARGSTPFALLDGGAYRATVYLTRLVWQAIEAHLGPARELMGWLRACADVATEHDLALTWTSPSGFPVLQTYSKWESKRIQTSLDGSVRWTRYREDTDELDGRRQANGAVPNFIHSIDAAILVRAVNKAREQGVTSIATIHDSYACLPSDAPRFLRALRSCVAGVMLTDWVARFRDEVEAQLPEGVKLPEPPAQGSWDPASVKDAVYWAS